MGKKRPSPLEEPPTASSSEDEEQLSSDDEAQKAEETEDEETSSGEEEEDDDDAEEQGKQSDFQAKPNAVIVADNKKQVLKNPQKPASSESGSESESETDSDAEPAVTKEKTVVPKPIASKPMDETPKKPRSKGVSTPTKSAPSKRPSENERETKDAKRAKKKGDDDNKVADLDLKKVGEDSKRQLFQRLWSEDDEIALLQGVYDYIVKKGKNPLTDIDGFLDFVKNSIHFEATQSQVLEKIRRLRKKYENNAGKGKEGKDRVFSKQHEQKSFELSKKIWGSDGAITAVEQAKSNGTARKNNRSGKISSVVKGEPVSFDKLLQESEKKLEKSANEQVGNVTIEKEKDSDATSRIIGMHKCYLGNNVDECFIRDGLELIDPARRDEFQTRWNKLQMEEWELHVKRLELIHEQTACILEAKKSK